MYNHLYKETILLLDEDSQSRMDYSVFSDVLIFDATYRKNKYSMPFAPFLGVNRRRRYVLFGCAALSDESLASYEWVFRCFIEAMSQKALVSIATSQNLVT